MKSQYERKIDDLRATLQYEEHKLSIICRLAYTEGVLRGLYDSFSTEIPPSTSTPPSAGN